MNAHRTLLSLATDLRQGKSTPRTLVDESLAAIDRLDAHLRAWVLVDADAARRAADQLTDELAGGNDRGPLHGIPLGIKDIVDVAGLPTRAGSPRTDPRPAEQDATVVARLREAGAVILGKTVTTEFACFDPAPTRNPWNAAHTPGGSSSGSAAAVAVGMCPGAIASQTGGSITRPASFCGVAGMKPTLGRTSRAGVVPVSFSLDHVGVMAWTAADCAVLMSAIAGGDSRDGACSPQPGFDWPRDPAQMLPAKPPRLGVLQTFFFEACGDETATLTGAALQTLVARGAEIVELPLPDGFDEVHARHRQIMACEAAEYHRGKYGAPREGYGPQMAGLIDEGLAITMGNYQEALRHRTAFRHAVTRRLEGVDALVVPSTVGPAPDTSTTGDARFNSPWSHAGVPTVSIPCALTAAGLPLSLQLIGPAWSDWPLLQTAIWCEQRLEFRDLAPLLAQRS